MAHWAARVRAAIRRPVNADALGQVDPELVAALAPVVLAAAERWYRLEVLDAEKIPAGAALVVGNHESGISFLEALGWGAHCVLTRPDEAWHALAHDQIVGLPALGPLLVQLGALRADPGVADRVLAAGAKLAVFPGGNLEAYRRWSRRNEVDFGGRTGFVRVAIRRGVPIVPVVFHGGHNGLFVLREGRRFAQWTRLDRLLRVDTWPLMIGLPFGLWFGPMFHLPLPVKVRVRWLDPIPTAHLGAAAADDPAVLRQVADDVVSKMQAAKYALAALG